MHQLILCASNIYAKVGRCGYADLSPFRVLPLETPKKEFRFSQENLLMPALPVHPDAARCPSHFGDRVSSDHVLRPGQKLQLATLYGKYPKRTFESSTHRLIPSLRSR